MLPLTTSLAGLLFGLSLIVAVGPQNVFVLRVGARGAGVGLVVGLCTLIDAVLIAAGVAGLGALLQHRPGLLGALRITGGLFLLGYAALAAVRVARPVALVAGGPTAARSLPALAAATAALSLLNPSVYLDTVVLLGSVAASHGSARWWFALGAAVGSALWFTTIGFGARRFGRRLTEPRAQRGVDAFVAVVLTVTAIRLIVG